MRSGRPSFAILDDDPQLHKRPRTLVDVYIKLTFVEVNGAWKVDQVTDLNFDAGSTPPSTTVPGSPTTSIP